MERQIQALRRLGLSAEEIADVLIADRKIDQGEKLFELSDEQKQVVKKMSGTGTKTVYQFQKRERKADNDKRFLIDAVYWLLTADISHSGDNVCADNVEVVNPEREILFTYNGKKYKITLSAPRG